MGVRHTGPFDFGYYLGQRYLLSRVWGGTQRNKAPFAKRLAYLVTAPLFPFLWLARIGRRVLESRRQLPRFAEALPLLLPVALVCVWGEWLGIPSRPRVTHWSAWNERQAFGGSWRSSATRPAAIAIRRISRGLSSPSPRRSTLRLSMEIVVPHHSAVTGITELKARYPHVHFVPVDSLKTFTGRGGSREHHDELPGVRSEAGLGRAGGPD